jgi:hypothetical protein
MVSFVDGLGLDIGSLSYKELPIVPCELTFDRNRVDLE